MCPAKPGVAVVAYVVVDLGKIIAPTPEALLILLLFATKLKELAVMSFPEEDGESSLLLLL